MLRRDLRGKLIGRDAQRSVVRVANPLEDWALGRDTFAAHSRKEKALFLFLVVRVRTPADGKSEQR